MSNVAEPSRRVHVFEMPSEFSNNSVFDHCLILITFDAYIVEKADVFLESDMLNRQEKLTNEVWKGSHKEKIPK